MDVFNLAEFIKAFNPQFSTETAHFHAAKRSREIVHQWVIDPDGASLNLFEKAFDQLTS